MACITDFNDIMISILGRVLMWRHKGNDIVSVAAICTAAQLIFLFGRTRLVV